MATEATLRCSFCNKAEDEVHKLIEAPAACIWDECIDLCEDILFEEAPSVRRSLVSAWRAWRALWRRPAEWVTLRGIAGRPKKGGVSFHITRRGPRAPRVT